MLILIYWAKARARSVSRCCRSILSRLDFDIIDIRLLGLQNLRVLHWNSAAELPRHSWLLLHWHPPTHLVHRKALCTRLPRNLPWHPLLIINDNHLGLLRPQIGHAGLRAPKYSIITWPVNTKMEVALSQVAPADFP